MTIIGGHPGLRVERKDRVIVKTAHRDDGPEYYRIALQSIKRDAWGLKAMAGSGYAPELLKQTKDSVTQTDLGDTEPVGVEQDFRRNCVWMLCETRKRGVRHGDLTDRNVIVREDKPAAIDWQESHEIGKPSPAKQPLSDSGLLFRCLSEWKDSSGAIDPSRTSRRWRAVLKALGADVDLTLPLKGKTFLDLGCFQGDFPAMARAELMEVEGVDHGGFRNGEDSVAIADALWKIMGCKFTRANIYDLPVGYFRRDVVMMFSTFAWMVQQRSHADAKRVLRQAIAEAGTLFFETQLAGDGPGPEWLPNNNHVRGLLLDLGAKGVEAIGTFPVPGRKAERTVWKVVG